MKLPTLHPWPTHVLEARELQGRLARTVTAARLRSPTRLLAGAAVEVVAQGGMVLAAVVVVEADGMHLVDVATHVTRTTFPHVPGYASFREVPALLSAFERLNHAPDVVLLNRPGQAHPRKLGTASHLGLWLQLPTVGVATELSMASAPNLAMAQGSTVPVLHEEDGLVIAMAVRSVADQPPLFVSVGHRITLLEAASVTLAACRDKRLPEPIRLAREQIVSLKKNLTRLDPEMAALVKHHKT